MANNMSNANAVSTSVMIGMGGPQTKEDRPTTATSVIAQATRTGLAHSRHQKLVKTVNRQRTPKASCIIVSTCCPIVFDRRY
jgi:hypothetical protein